MSVITEKIEYEEGFEDKPYHCPAGYLTIGFGFNLESTPMPRKVAEYWLNLIIRDIGDKLAAYDWFVDLDFARKVVIYDMTYQMGLSGMLAFKNMISALSNKDFDKAAKELMDSLYARQTPNRAQRNYQILLTGKL